MWKVIHNFISALRVRKHTQVFIEFGLGLERVVNILNIKTEINGCLQISISAQWCKKFYLSRTTMYIVTLYIRVIYTLCNIKSTGHIGCDVNESPCICIGTLYNVTVCGNHALKPLVLFVKWVVTNAVQFYELCVYLTLQSFVLSLWGFE